MGELLELLEDAQLEGRVQSKEQGLALASELIRSGTVSR
jgi:predicted HTH domain antitoxin